MQGDFSRHAGFNGRITEVRDQTLDNTHVANHYDRHNLLFDVNDDSIQATDQIVITFSTGESVEWLFIRESGSSSFLDSNGSLKIYIPGAEGICLQLRK